MLAALHAPVHATESAVIREAARAVLSDDDFQIALPKAQPPSEVRAFEWPEWIGHLAEILIWAFGIALVVIFLWQLWQHRRGFSSDRSGAARQAVRAVAADRATPRTASAPRRHSADALAAEGRYADAIHMLLLDILDRVKLTSERRLSDSLTSREILRLGFVANGASDDLAALVTAVERFHFGGRTAAADDFAACRDRYASVIATVAAP